MENESILLTIREASDALRLSRTKLYELLGTGDLPSIKIGGSRRIRRSDLEVFVDNAGAGTDDG